MRNERGTGPHHARRFPPPWSVEEGKTYFLVKDNDGRSIEEAGFRADPEIEVMKEVASKTGKRCRFAGGKWRTAKGLFVTKGVWEQLVKRIGDRNTLFRESDNLRV
jgi:hypothetical protein